MSKKMSKKRISMGEALQRYGRAVRIWQKYSPQLLPSTVLYQLFFKGTPFVTIYLSALILNALVLRQPAAKIWTLVVITVTVTAVLAMITHVLNRWYETNKAGIWSVTLKIFADKKADMDFVSADSQQVADMESQAEQNMNWGGWGLSLIEDITSKLIGSVVSIVGGVALSVQLFLLPVRKSDLIFLNNPLCLLLILALIAGAIAVSWAFTKYENGVVTRVADSARLGNRLFKAYSHLASEATQGSLDIRLYNQEKIGQYHMNKKPIFTEGSLIDRLYRGKLGFLTAASRGVQSIMSGLIYLFVCLKAWGGAFPIGSATQYIGAVTGVFTGISEFIANLEAIRTNGEFLTDTYGFLDAPHTMYKGSLTTEKRSDRQYQIEFRDVSFKYPGASDYALRHVTMSFRVGSRLAVVGMNGSGKTTFIKLLCRLYDPTEGHILLNGIDIRKYRYQDYMNIFSIVFQDFQLFAMPLGQNVATSTHYDRDKVMDCLVKAGFADRLASLPQGLDTNLYKDLDKEGVNISGGEAQKIAIARALYKDAPFIVLDEPTAALDPVAEADIYSKFDEIAGRKTAIYISHRLSSCKFCDDIAVFDQGRVVQKGTHTELLADSSGKYYQLWNAQAQYYVK